MKADEFAAAEAIIKDVLRTYGELGYTWLEPRLLLGELYILQERNDEALEVLTYFYRPYRLRQQDALICIPAARKGDFDLVRRAINMRLWPEAVESEFGGLENLPSLDSRLPHNDLARSYQAFGYLLLGSDTKSSPALAVSYLTKAEALFPDNPAVQYWLGARLLKCGDKEGARGHLLRAQATAQGNLVQMVQQKLRESRSD